jgi:hypothetical protein
MAMAKTLTKADRKPYDEPILDQGCRHSPTCARCCGKRRGERARHVDPFGTAFPLPRLVWSCDRRRLSDATTRRNHRGD